MDAISGTEIFLVEIDCGSFSCRKPAVDFHEGAHPNLRNKDRYNV